jgi:cytidine deaminase
MEPQDTLIRTAREAALRAYAPYSKFRVGAALLCEDGAIVPGSNVENRSYGLTNCAERSAVFAAVSLGKRSFKGIALYLPDSAEPVPPCGACRQVLTEFASPDFFVLAVGSGGKSLTVPLGELYPLDSLHDLQDRTGRR